MSPAKKSEHAVSVEQPQEEAAAAAPLSAVGEAVRTLVAALNLPVEIKQIQLAPAAGVARVIGVDFSARSVRFEPMPLSTITSEGAAS